VTEMAVKGETNAHCSERVSSSISQRS